MKNYYEILGFKERAHHSKVAAKHRQITNLFILNRRKGNPDSPFFIEQTEAYFLLKNPRRKAKYDHLHALKFDTTPVKRNKNAEKWEIEIATEALRARAAAEEVAQFSNEELNARLTKLSRDARQRSSYKRFAYFWRILFRLPD